MSSGDIINYTVSIAAGANLDFQPAIGSEYMITNILSEIFVGVTPNQGYMATLRHFNGAITTTIYRLQWNPRIIENLKFMINNGFYFRLTNDDINPRILGFSGIQLK